MTVMRHLSRGGRHCKGSKSGGKALRRPQLPNEVLPKIRSSPRAIQNRFIALLKPPFKSSDDYQQVGWGKKLANTRLRIGRNRDKQGSV
jgi:hypothetical protein